MLFDCSSIYNAHGAAITADGWDSLVEFDRDHVRNDGKIDATWGGTVGIDHSTIDNWHGTISADGRGSTVDVDHSTIFGGTLAANGFGAKIELDDAFVSRSFLQTTWGGLIETGHGTSYLSDATIGFNSDVEVEKYTKLVLEHGTEMFGGELTIDKHATLQVETTTGATLDGTTVFNHGTMQVDAEF